MDYFMKMLMSAPRLCFNRMTRNKQVIFSK